MDSNPPESLPQPLAMPNFQIERTHMPFICSCLPFFRFQLPFSQYINISSDSMLHHHTRQIHHGERGMLIGLELLSWTSRYRPVTMMRLFDSLRLYTLTIGSANSPQSSPNSSVMYLQAWQKRSCVTSESISVKQQSLKRVE